MGRAAPAPVLRPSSAVFRPVRGCGPVSRVVKGDDALDEFGAEPSELLEDYRRIAALLRDAGWHVNDKRVERLWRRERLKVPGKQPKRGRLWLNDGSCIRLRAERADHVWSYDFVHHRTHDGRASHMLNVLDEFTRESLAMRVRRKLSSADVIDVPTNLFIVRGIPGYIRSDNGPEFVAAAVRQWVAAVGARTAFIEPGSPWENGYIESFNGKRWSGRPPIHGVTMRQEDTHAVCGQGIRGASMDNVSIIGLDISKRSFQVHGAMADGAPVLRRKLTRAKVLEFLASQPRCLVVMETCGGAHHWGREIQQLGHEVRFIAPMYVKVFAKRQKSDARDAAAIVEAAQRPTMRFVAVKTQQAQARSMVYRTRGLLVRQRTQTVNAIRGHLAEFRVVLANQGGVHIRLVDPTLRIQAASDKALSGLQFQGSNSSMRLLGCSAIRWSTSPEGRDRSSWRSR